MKLSDKQQRAFWWSSRIFALLALLSGAIAAFGFMPPLGSQISGAAAALAGIVSRWCEQHLPPKEKKE